ncbi:MAG: hypothetical protein QM779_10820 [Propionicimonas sp.]|uniref:hypothetical protein n=1 Tax=Propionicimonas sp. TaxID=1955623 RepID=UPI003D1486E2
MDRRGFLLGVTAVLAAGCARVPPAEAGGSPSAEPTLAPMVVGQDGTSAEAVFAQLLVAAVAATGQPAVTGPVEDGWQAALGHGDLAALPAFGGTLWASLSQDDEPPAAKDLPGEVAGLLEPDVSVLEAGGVDGALVWLVTQETAEAGITSLSRIGSWSKGKIAAIPPMATSRADGVPGLRTVYGAQFSVMKVENPVERASRLANGDAAIAAFRRTDYTGASGMVELVDTQKLAVVDPGLVLVNTALTDSAPDQVLAMNQVAQVVTTDMLIDLQAQVAAGGTVADVASRWVKDQGIG